MYSISMSYRAKLIFTVFALVTTAFSQTSSFEYELNPDSNSVERILQYNVTNILQSEIESLGKAINNRTYFEFHLGADLIKEAGEKVITTASLGLKISPYCPKMVSVRDIKVKINKIKGLSKMIAANMTQSNDSLIQSYEKELTEYENFKWKRFGLMLSFPLGLFYQDTIRTTYSFDELSHYRISTRIQPNFKPFAVASVCYDIGEICTVALGVSFPDKPRLVAALSIDISTPTYYAAMSFINHLKSFTQVGLPSSYYMNQ
jgi:hypothetical protein